MLITRITLRVISGYVTLDYIIIIKKLIFVNLWSERREYLTYSIGSMKGTSTMQREVGPGISYRANFLYLIHSKKKEAVQIENVSLLPCAIGNEVPPHGHLTY